MYIVTSSPPLFKFSSESLIPQPFPELLQQSRKHLIVVATCHDFGNAIHSFNVIHVPNLIRIVWCKKIKKEAVWEKNEKKKKEWKEKKIQRSPSGISQTTLLSDREPRNRVDSCGSFSNLDYIPYLVDTNNLWPQKNQWNCDNKIPFKMPN